MVIKNATGDSSGLRIFQDSSDVAKIYNNYAGTLELGLSNTTMFKIANSGGNTMLFGNGGADGYTLPYDQNPGYSNFSAGGFGFLFREASDSYLIGNVYYYKTGGAQSWRYKFGSAGGNVLSLDSGNYRFNTVGSGSADAVASFTERFTILQAGNVGVGQDAPQHKLEVTGNICINSESTSTGDPTEIDKLIFQKQHADGSSGPYTLGEVRSYTTGGYSGGLKFYTGKSTGGGSYASTHAMTLDQNQAATFVGDVILSSGSPELYFHTTGNHYNWMIAAQENTDGVLEIGHTSSTGTAHEATPGNYSAAIKIYAGSSGAVDFSGNIRTADDTVVRTGYDSTGGGPAIQLNYSHSTGDYLGNISSEYSSGGIMIGYGCHGKVGAAGFQSSYDNFSYGHSAFNCDGQQFEWWHDSSNSQTTVGNDVPNMVQIMQLTRGGQLQIGNTSAIWGGEKLMIYNTSAEGIAVTTNDVNHAAILTKSYAASTSAHYVLYVTKNNAANVGSITHNDTNTAFNTSSDYRLKEDLKDFSGLETLSKIKMYDFKWKDTDQRQHGAIAHELDEVTSYAVTGEKDGMRTYEDKEVEEYQGVDYAKLVPILVKSVQEQQTTIEDLKKRIETLEG